MQAQTAPALYGIVAEFNTPDEVVRAARKARKEGYSAMDAYTPFPVHGLDEASHFEDNRIKWMIFLMGLLGGGFGLWLIWWINTTEYPMNVGGRPLFSWPSFIPVTFECTVLFASLTAFFGMLALNGLPQPHHPIFNAENFERCSQDKFFLCIEACDPKFDAVETASFLETLHAENVSEVRS